MFGHKLRSAADVGLNINPLWESPRRQGAALSRSKHGPL